MSLTVTQRPYQTINGEVSKWNAVRNPILYKMQRKDFTFNQINNNAGDIQVQINTTDYTSSFIVGDICYIQSDNGVYDLAAEITVSAYSGGNTLITLDSAYISAAPGGFINNHNLRPGYKVETAVYNEADVLLNTISYAPNSKGLATINVSSILRYQLSPNNDTDFSTETYDDVNIYIGFYIKYTETWTSSAESQTNDSANVFYAIFGALQIPSTYGGNFYDYINLSDMKSTDTNILTAAVLTSNGSPVNVSEVPTATQIAVPVMWLVYLDYAGVAYATNTTFRFEINGVPVSGTNTTILPGTADRWTTILPIAYDTTTDLKGHPIKFETQSGNPTAGTSPIRVISIYTLRDLS